MPYIATIHFKNNLQHPFPYDIPAIRYCNNIDINNAVTFLIGDNGTGKSTLLETVAFRLQLPHIDGSTYIKSSFDAARTLVSQLRIEWAIDYPRGFFFRAEDFGDYINSVSRTNAKLFEDIDGITEQVPESVIKEMKENANYQIHHMRENFGQDLQSFSHGEAFMHIMQEKLIGRGIYLLDEPEAALSPSKQLSLLYFIQQHLRRFRSQFIIATHSPMIMALPNAVIYEISENGMQKTPLEETEHYSITKSFLNNPEAYLRHLT